MAKVKATSSEDIPKTRPALTPESRENQMISLAVDLAEKQLKDGTASFQVITHFLKLATVREKLERERLAKENRLLDAKTESLQRDERIEEMYKNAINAMRRYGGYGGQEEDEDDPDLF